MSVRTVPANCADWPAERGLICAARATGGGR